MKTILPLFAAILSLVSANAQYSENFESGSSALTGNCWVLNDVFHTTNGPDVITGTGSMYTNPPTSSTGTRDISTPALNVVSTSLTVSFNYKLSNKLNGQATRSIEVGLVDPAGTFTSLQTITLDKDSPITVLTFNETFTLASTGYRRLVLRLGGSTGDGNSRLIFDDLYVSASPMYAGICNTAPVAGDDVFNGPSGSVVTGNVMTNDSDANGESIAAAMVVTSPDGTVVLNADGSFTFTPNAGFAGASTTFTYQVVDNGFDVAASNVATVTINFSFTIVLPVKLVSFTAQLGNNNTVDLKWATSTEIDASHFVIERSIDGKNYSQAGVVFATGNSNSIVKYQFADQIGSTDKTIFYYRLRQVDIDDRFEYSAVRVIRIGKQNETSINILTYPNPVVNDLRITIPANWQGKKVTYELFTSNGQVAKKIEANSASQTETMNLNGLATGFYMVKATCENETAIQKLIKK